MVHRNRLPRHTGTLLKMMHRSDPYGRNGIIISDLRNNTGVNIAK